jgi:hypothetical protein
MGVIIAFVLHPREESRQESVQSVGGINKRVTLRAEKIFGDLAAI